MRLPAFARLAPVLALLGLTGCGMPMQNIQAENRAIPWIFEVAACDSALVLGSIQQRFARSEAEFGHDGQQIMEIRHIRQTSLRKNGPAYIPRRGCIADVILQNNHRSRVHYTVVAETGAYSLGDNVEFCVEGHDHAHRAEPACSRMTR
jgi:hypothetical protein